VPSIDRDCPQKTSRFNEFDSGSAPQREKIQHSLPLKGWTEVKPKNILICGLDFLLSRKAADLRRRAVVELANTCVESSDGAEARCNGNLVHWQADFIDQLFCKMNYRSPR
jgi:hypothetical protein